MKSISLKVLAVTLLGLSVLPACNKYEDGPGFSLRTRKARMVNNWKIDRAYDDGDEVTDNYDNYELDLGKSESATLRSKGSFAGIDFNVSTSGTWRFINKDEELDLNFENDDFDQVYEILKLENDALWLRERGDDLELHLIPR
ncbi:MAG: hypothetical protein V4616_06800 [Bacteroidota bacterium]